ncbi:MAG: SAM-dependent chlorinase/fluorinase [Chloroflexota bacterium]|nr:SAM-dependent chlorinase/fluorinase [Chloroflexota bacterium]
MTIITLTTDFGEQDGYVGIIKGVIHSINPSATVIDISHLVEPQNVLQGAFLLHISHNHFPSGTIHLAVVDPGVKTERRTICLEVPNVGFFIGPDNGLFSYILNGYPNAVAREPVNPAYHRHLVSSTFYGRDVYAPVAAHLSKGEPFEQVGPLVDLTEVACFEDLWPQWEQQGKRRVLQGYVRHIDHFGNIISNIHPSQLENLSAEELKGLKVYVDYNSPNSNRKVRLETTGLKANYGEGTINELIALYGSSDFLELARVSGYAAFEKLGMKVQDSSAVRFSFKQPVVDIGLPFIVEI